MQEYYLHIVKFFLHVPEENKICRGISYTCNKKIKCGRICHTCVGTILPALSCTLKCRKLFTKVNPFSFISMVTPKNRFIFYFGTC